MKKQFLAFAMAAMCLTSAVTVNNVCGNVVAADSDTTAAQTKKKMTLDDVKELSKKGKSLDWEDLDAFEAKWRNAGVYSRFCKFDLGDGFFLVVGGEPNFRPETVWLCYSSMDNYVDVKTGDVSEFISKYAKEDKVTTTTKAAVTTTSKAVTTTTTAKATTTTTAKTTTTSKAVTTTTTAKATTTTTVSEMPVTLKGDANCDGQVDLSDAVMIMQALANPNKYGIGGTAEKHLTEQGQINGDMDGDGLTVGDAQAIQRKLLGLDEKATDLEALRKQLSDFFAEEKIDYAVIPKDKMPEQFADKYVFIKVNTVDTGYAARYGAFLKSSDIYSSLIKSIPYKIDSDTELNKIRTLLYCYILENNINASVDPTDEEADLINKTVLVKYADSEKTREQLENFIKEKNIDLNLVEFFAVE